MRIASLRITNFRSFGPDTVEIDLSRGMGYHVVVGPNAAGKSNLLEAIRWVTLDRQVSGDSITEGDFHKNKTDAPIRIEATLDPPLKHGDTFNKFSDVALLRLEAKEYEITAEKGSIRCDHPALTADGKAVMIGQTIPVAKGKTLTAEEKNARQHPRPLMVRDIKGKIPIYFLDTGMYHFHLSMSRGSLTSLLARLLHDDLLRDDNRIQWREKETTRAEAIRNLLDELAPLLKTDRTTEILGAMSRFMALQLQLPEDALSLGIGLPSGMELLKKLEILGRDFADNPNLPIEQLGKGYAALAVVALFRAVNELGDAREGSVVLIEEPEMYLGPHLRSLFASTLQEFALRGNQVIVVTHAAEFIDPEHPQSIILTRKECAATKCVQWPKGAAPPPFDANLKFIEPNLDRLVLSGRLLFVEGDDDYAAIMAAFELAGVEPALHGLEILRVGGKDKIEYFASYAKNFGIPYAILFDKDAEQRLKGIDPQGKTWKMFAPDLEGALNTTKQRPNSLHVASVVEAQKEWSKLEQSCPDFANPLKDALSMLSIDMSGLWTVPTSGAKNATAGSGSRLRSSPAGNRRANQDSEHGA